MGSTKASKKPKIRDKSYPLRKAAHAAGHASYDAFLASPAWAMKQKAYRESIMPQHCLGCGSHSFQLHHRSYDRLGKEELHDLVPLCRECHVLVHANDHQVTGLSVRHTHLILADAKGWTPEETARRFASYPTLPSRPQNPTVKRKNKCNWRIPSAYEVECKAKRREYGRLMHEQAKAEREAAKAAAKAQPSAPGPPLRRAIAGRTPDAKAQD